MKNDKVVVTTPSGKEVEMLTEQEYYNKYTTGYAVLPENYDPSSKESLMMSSRINLPMPHDYNNWTFFLLKDTSIYDTLSEEDRKFIMVQQYEQYTSIWEPKTNS